MAGTPIITQTRPSYVCQTITSTGPFESRLNALETISVQSIAQDAIATIGATGEFYEWSPNSIAAPGPGVVIPLGQPLGTAGRWLLLSSLPAGVVYNQFIEGLPLAATTVPVNGALVAAVQQSTLRFNNADVEDGAGHTDVTLYDQQVFYTSLAGATVAMPQRARIHFESAITAPGLEPVIVTDDPVTDSTRVQVYQNLPGAISTCSYLFRPSPLGGADDWANLQDLCTNGLRNICMQPSQTFNCKSFFDFPDNFTLNGSVDGGLVCALPNEPQNKSCPFRSQGTWDAPPLTTLTAQPARLSRVIAVANAAGIVGESSPGANDGTRIILESPLLSLASYNVISVVGLNVTVERPILRTFPAGTLVSNVPRFPTNIRILGNDMKVTGYADRAMWIMNARNCLFADLNFDFSAGNAAGTFDVGGVGNEARNIHYIQRSISVGVPVGFSLEVQEHSKLVDCTMDLNGFLGSGTILGSCHQCDLIRCSTQNGYIGFDIVGLLIGAVVDTAGNEDCRLVECVSLNNSTRGINVVDGSNNIIQDCISTGNGDVGLYSDGILGGQFNLLIEGGRYDKNTGGGITLLASKDARITNVQSVTGNGNSGINVGDNCTGTAIDGVRVEGNAFAGIGAGGSISIANAHTVANGAGGGGIYTGVDSQVTIENLISEQEQVGIYATPNSTLSRISVDGWILNSAVANAQAVNQAGSNVKILVRNLYLQSFPPVAWAFILSASSVLDISHSDLRNTNFSWTGVATVRQGPNVLFALGVTSGASYVSRGNPVVAAGAVPVAFAWPDMQATDSVTLVRTANGGTPGPTPLVAITAGVGASITATAGDTSTYRLDVN